MDLPRALEHLGLAEPGLLSAYLGADAELARELAGELLEAGLTSTVEEGGAQLLAASTAREGELRRRRRASAVVTDLEIEVGHQLMPVVGQQPRTKLFAIQRSSSLGIKPRVLCTQPSRKQPTSFHCARLVPSGVKR